MLSPHCLNTSQSYETSHIVHLCKCCVSSFFPLQSVLPFFVATKLSKIRRATLDKPSPERYVSAELNTVGLQTQTNGYLPHAIMVSLGM